MQYNKNLIYKKTTEKIIGLAIEVHKELGPGLLENVYKQCLAYEFKNAGLKFELEKRVPVKYKEVLLDCNYKIDMLVEDKIIIELKTVDSLLDVHMAQLLTYLRISNKKLGLLINFKEALLKDGIKRLIL